MKILASIVLLLAGTIAPSGDRFDDRDPTNPGIKEVLLLGDSVMAGIARSQQGKDYLSKHHSYIFGAVGCQRISTIGCTKSSKMSALEILKLNSGMFKNALVISTGYNDFNNASIFRKNVYEICAEAKKQEVLVFWLTYREAGNVEKKSKAFNQVLNTESSRIENLRIIDWNSFSTDSKGWFAGDKIHLQGIGPLKMAQFISDAIDSI